ncbi:aminotransferase DegT [Clostridia bacterium]|nr:aminotransferase DegT [Clostridia bacterium]
MCKLALGGGEKTVKESKEYGVPLVAEETYSVIEEILRSGQISVASVTGQLEREFAAYVGTRYALCTPNGTTAIQAALFAAGVGPGDEVIVPSFTFWATVGPVVVNNAVPVFADVSLDGHNLTAETIAPHITKKTKAILLVHVWGVPCDMDSIGALAKKHGLKVVTDCAHAHGAKYGGKKNAIVGDAAAFSLQASKTMPGGEGGILVTDDREIYERAVALGHYERLGGLPPDSSYNSLSLTGGGYKHRIHPVAAAIALGNLHRLDASTAIRNANAARLEEWIRDLDFIVLQKSPPKSGRTYSYHYMRYLPDGLNGVSTSTFLKALAAEGVLCGSCGYGRLHTAPLYTGEGSPFGKAGPFKNPYWERYAPTRELPNTELLAQTAFLAAPRFEYADEKDVELYAKAYRKVRDNVKELTAYDKSHGEAFIDNAGRSINYVK